MTGRNQFTPSEGPSPTDVDRDPGESLEDMISDMDHYEGADDDTTASEQRDGDTIDDRTRREQPQRVRRGASVDLVDDGGGDDGVDREKDLVADTDPIDGPLAPELAAMHVRDDAPGVVDHPDDYVSE
ncbi:MAG TPA: hypothetical protein VNC60_02475 [Actinomycetota bacterium]|nr:hypothetical protein [Actinomycetota bacterium]